MEIESQGLDRFITSDLERLDVPDFDLLSLTTSSSESSECDAEDPELLASDCSLDDISDS